jgi:hypothetical protein
MKARWTELLLIAGAVILLLVGLVWSSITVQQLERTGEQLDRKQQDLQTLTALEARLSKPKAALQLMERTGASGPVDLQNLLRTQFPGQRLEARWREEREAAGGWRTVVMEVEANRISAVEVSRLLNITENQQPPWRLVECEVRALDASPETLDALLIFEGLLQPDS